MAFQGQFTLRLIVGVAANACSRSSRRRSLWATFVLPYTSSESRCSSQTNFRVQIWSRPTCFLRKIPALSLLEALHMRRRMMCRELAECHSPEMRMRNSAKCRPFIACLHRPIARISRQKLGRMLVAKQPLSSNTSEIEPLLESTFRGSSVSVRWNPLFETTANRLRRRAKLFGRLPAVGHQGAQGVARNARQESWQAREQVAEVSERLDVFADA